MNEPLLESPQPARRGFPLWVLLVPLVPVLYVLSIGPAYAFFSEAQHEKLARFYAPLVWAVHHSEWVLTAVNSYLKLWVG